jgi:hypothetical protein
VRVFRFGGVDWPYYYAPFDPLPGTSYTGEDGRWLLVDAFNALLARLNTATVAADLMRARAERAEAALRFYASDDTYCQSHGPDCRVSGDPEAPEQVCDSSCGWPEILRDNGAKARAALRAGGG